MSAAPPRVLEPPEEDGIGDRRLSSEDSEDVHARWQRTLEQNQALAQRVASLQVRCHFAASFPQSHARRSLVLKKAGNPEGRLACQVLASMVVRSGSRAFDFNRQQAPSTCKLSGLV